MRMTQKILVWLVAALLMTSPIFALANSQDSTAALPNDQVSAAAVASDQVTAATPLGGSGTFSLEWHNHPLIEEDTNAIVSSILSAAALSGAYGTDENGGFFSGDLLIDGVSQLPFDIYVDDQALYINSPALNGAASFDFEEMIQIMSEPGESEDIFAFISAYSTVLEVQQSLLVQSAGGIDLLMEGLQMEALMEGLFTLFSASVENVVNTGRPFDGIIHSAIGGQTTRANLYTITEGDLADVAKDLFNLLADHEEYWDATISLYGPEFFDSMNVSREEVLAEIIGMFRALADSIESTDSINIRIYECLDAQGEPALYQVKVEPTEYDSGAFINMIEWAPGQMSFYAALGDEYEHAEIKLEQTKTGWRAFFAANDWYEPRLFMVEVSNEDGRTLLEIVQLQDGQMANGLTLDWAAAGDTLEATLGVILEGQREPLITARLTRTDEVVSARFDPNTFEGEIADLFAMSPEEQMEWAQMVEITAMQAAMRVCGALPPDVYLMIMDEISFF